MKMKPAHPNYLALAKRILRGCGCTKAAGATERAQNSAEGAHRHCLRRVAATRTHEAGKPFGIAERLRTKKGGK